MRPTSITVIAWILIVGSAIKAPWTLSLLHDPQFVESLAHNSSLPVRVQYFDMVADPVVAIVVGIGLLKGQNWARVLYLVAGVIGLLLNFATCRVRPIMIIPAAVFLAIIYFLFRSEADQYFRGKKAPRVNTTE